MAKKRKPRGVTQQFPGVTFTSEVIRHTNAITLAADSTTAVAESIDTPGYSEVGYSGCFIVGAQISPAPAVASFNPDADSSFTVQIQTGDRAGTPAMINPDDVGFFAQLHISTQLQTSGVYVITFPMPIPISLPVPIIVMPQFTICVDCSANVTEYAGDEMFTEIFYRTVKLADRAYTGLLLQQQRIS